MKFKNLSFIIISIVIGLFGSLLVVIIQGVDVYIGEIHIAMPYSTWSGVYNQNYSTIETYKDIQISTEDNKKLENVKNWLSIDYDFSHIKNIYYTNEMGYCRGFTNQRNNYRDIFVSDCNRNSSIRGEIFLANEWLPFVFYHEVAHGILNTRNSKEDQIATDELGYEIREIWESLEE